MPETVTCWTVEKSAKTPVPAASVTFKKKQIGGGAGNEASHIQPTYHHVAGACRDAVLCDGEIEFEERRVGRPVRSPFALLFGMHRVEGQQRLVVSVKVDGTQEDVENHRLGAAHDLDV